MKWRGRWRERWWERGIHQPSDPAVLVILLAPDGKADHNLARLNFMIQYHLEKMNSTESDLHDISSSMEVSCVDFYANVSKDLFCLLKEDPLVYLLVYWICRNVQAGEG